MADRSDTIAPILLIEGNLIYSCSPHQENRYVKVDLKISITEFSSMLKHSLIASAVLSVLLLDSCSRTVPLDDVRLRCTDQDTSSWLMYRGLTTTTDSVR